MRFFKRQRHGAWKDITEREYIELQGKDLAAAHVQEVVAKLMATIPENRYIEISTLEIHVEVDYGDYSLHASVSTYPRENS